MATQKHLDRRALRARRDQRQHDSARARRDRWRPNATERDIARFTGWRSDAPRRV